MLSLFKLHAKLNLGWDLIGQIGRIGPFGDDENAKRMMKNIENERIMRNAMKGFYEHLLRNEDLYKIKCNQRNISFFSFLGNLDELRTENRKIPDDLVFSICFNTETIEFYEEICEELKLLNDTCSINYGKVKKLVIKTNIKEEFKDKAAFIVEEGKIIQYKFDKLCSEMKLLGVNIEDIPSPKCPEIPDDFYEKEIKYEANITIKCNKNDKFYKLMLDNGLLRLYYPKWFKYGEY